VSVVVQGTALLFFLTFSDPMRSHNTHRGKDTDTPTDTTPETPHHHQRPHTHANPTHRPVALEGQHSIRQGRRLRLHHGCVRVGGRHLFFFFLPRLRAVAAVTVTLWAAGLVGGVGACGWVVGGEMMMRQGAQRTETRPSTSAYCKQAGGRLPPCSPGDFRLAAVPPSLPLGCEPAGRLCIAHRGLPAMGRYERPPCSSAASQPGHTHTHTTNSGKHRCIEGQYQPLSPLLWLLRLVARHVLIAEAACVV
jgi:hypothetical protein